MKHTPAPRQDEPEKTVRQDGWGTAPEQTTRTPPEPERHHPTVVTVSQAANMPHIALVDWSVATSEGADSGMFSINLTAPMMMRLVRSNTDEQERTLLVLTRREEVARIKASITGSSELYSAMWGKLSAMRDQIASQTMSELNQHYRMADQRHRMADQRRTPGVTSRPAEAERPARQADQPAERTRSARTRSARPVPPTPEPNASSEQDHGIGEESGNSGRKRIVISVTTVFALILVASITGWFILNDNDSAMNAPALQSDMDLPEAQGKPNPSAQPPGQESPASTEDDEPWTPE